MSDTCSDLKGSAVETIVLAFDLAGYELKNGPSQVLKALEDKKVQEAIRDALTSQAKEFLKEQKNNMPIDARTALSKTGTAVGKALLDAGTSNLKQQIQLTSAYQRLDTSLRNLKCAYEKSVIGAWVDEHKVMLIIVASGVVLGGLTAMYLTNTGDTPADWATQLAKDKIKTTVLGKLELGVSDIKFVPSKRDVGLTSYAQVKDWKFLKNAKLDVNVQVTDDKLKHLGATLQTTVPLGRNFQQTTKLSADPISKDYSLALGISGGKDGLSVKIVGEVARHGDKTSLSADGSLGYKTKVGGMPLSLDAGLGASRIMGPGSTKTEYHGQIGLSLAVDFLK